MLCGGLGTRLGELTRETPKPLLPIEGEPLLGYTLALLARHGVTDVALNLHFGAEMFRRYVGDGSRFGVGVTYFPEEVLLGTAGTVRALAPFFGTDDALVVYGDLLLNVDLRELFAAHRERVADATLMVHRRAGSNSVVELDESRRIVRFVERPPDEARPDGDSWVHSGVAVLGPAARARIPDLTPCDLPRDLYASHVATLRLFGAPLEGHRTAIDSPARYEAACRAVRAGLVPPR